MDVVPGYEPLAEVFQTAHDQAARGKGKDRHADSKPFLQQPIFAIGRMVGVGYNVGQAMKKGQESMRLPDDRAQAELLGAMVYLASAYLLIGERMEAEKRAAVEEAIPANSLGDYFQNFVVPHVTERPLPEIFVGDAAAHKAPSLCDSETLDFSLPSIILKGSRSDVLKKYAEEEKEWESAVDGSDHQIIEAWDCLQAKQTYAERGGCGCDINDRAIFALDKYHKEGRPVMSAKAGMLYKNARRGYYAPEVCKIILESNGERWR